MTRTATPPELRRQQLDEEKIVQIREKISLKRFDAERYQRLLREKIQTYRRYLRDNNLSPIKEDVINDSD